MSNHTKQNIVGAKLGMVIQGKRPSVMFHRKLVFIIILTVIIIAGVIVTVLIFHNNDGQPSIGTSITEVQKPANSDLQQIAKFTVSNKYDQAAALALKNANAATTSNDKASWYTQLYSIYANAGKNDVALNYALQAYNLNQSDTNAETVAGAYTAIGDVANAQLYIQKAIDKLDKTSPSYALHLKELKYKLTGQQQAL